MIPEEHIAEAQRQREARTQRAQRQNAGQDRRPWQRKMQAQCAAIKAMPELWEWLTYTLPASARGDGMTTTELGLVRLGEAHVVECIERFARWRDEE